MSIEHSRSLLLAAGVSDDDERTLKQRQEAALTLVRVDTAVPLAGLTARVLLTTLRRLPGRLALDRTGLDDDTLAAIIAAVSAIDSARPLLVVDTTPDDVDVHLAIALIAEPQFVRVVPDGYGAQLANDPAVLLALGQPANALGAVFAAALGAAEAFKHIVVDKQARCTLHPHLSFCPVTLDTNTAAAPALSSSLPLDTAIIGNGAIGTAVGLILSEMRLGGRIVVCDPELYGPENRGTYSLGGEREVANRTPKVDLLEAVLADAGYDVRKVQGKSTVLIELIDKQQIAAPPTTITGLDTAEARRETQMLWPDHLVDAATGDTAVGLHHAVPTGPCLRCFFPQRTAGPDPLLQLATLSGLPVSLLRRGADALTDEHLASLTPGQREPLKHLVGQPVCGLAAAFGLTNANAAGYLPSVPFVSQLAACLAVGRLLAIEMGVPANGNFFQFDALHGPLAESESRNAVVDCYCQTRQASVIRTVRERRWGRRNAA